MQYPYLEIKGRCSALPLGRLARASAAVLLAGWVGSGFACGLPEEIHAPERTVLCSPISGSELERLFGKPARQDGDWRYFSISGMRYDLSVRMQHGSVRTVIYNPRPVRLAQASFPTLRGQLLRPDYTGEPHALGRYLRADFEHFQLRFRNNSRVSLDRIVANFPVQVPH
ncbi:hypothetical protein PSEUDO9AZ_40197 [Pseudomonas sp. 9AZ]|uniref:hypothetical protein n=1 Tax=Pseudomonas sp. 9AZ TaxID=2653168 RepID=UPI0012F0486C|nr:hypothetical protein [Pseudomonas sp. 9AZ]VXD00252.1 hypothetical protein PSEUDO9AZ_40197 [Pseudomonas sp. 9AZ]